MLLVRTARWLNEILLLDFASRIAIDATAAGSHWRAQVTAIPSMPLDPSKAGSPCTVAILVSVPSDATA
jgi:hypothetical protein